MENTTVRSDSTASIGECVDKVMAQARVNQRRETETAESIERKKQQRIRKTVSLIASQLGPRYSWDRVSKWHDAGPDAEAVYQRLSTIIETSKAFTVDPPSLILIGPVGTGKEHLVAWLLYRAAFAGVSASWVNGQEVFGEFRDRIKTGEDEQGLLQQLVQPQILAIADPIPVSGEPSPYNLNQLYRIVDRRYCHLRPTWVTLNIRNEQEADTRLTAPVWDRLCDGAEIVRCFWPSYRKPR